MTTGHLKNFYFPIAYQVEGSGCQTNTLRCQGKKGKIGSMGSPRMAGSLCDSIAYLIFLCVERNDDFGPQSARFATRNAKLSDSRV